MFSLLLPLALYLTLKLDCKADPGLHEDLPQARSNYRLCKTLVALIVAIVGLNLMSIVLYLYTWYTKAGTTTMGFYYLQFFGQSLAGAIAVASPIILMCNNDIY